MQKHNKLVENSLRIKGKQPKVSNITFENKEKLMSATIHFTWKNGIQLSPLEENPLL